MLRADQLAGALTTLPTVAMSTTFVRRVPAFALFGIKGPLPSPGQPIAAISPNFFFSTGSSYRYNPPGIASIYFGESESTAGAEIKQHPGARGFDYDPRMPDVVYHVNVNLSAMLDLTDAAVQNVLQTTTSELTANWRLLSPNAPTQLLGKSAFDCGRFEGLRYPSAAKAREAKPGSCVVIFSARKAKTSIVQVMDESKTFTQEL
jgi:RES domain-containing protein